MNESTKLILSGLGGGVLVLSAMFGLDKADVIEPTPKAPAISADCPKGWTDESDEAQDTLVYSCTKDGWIVILTPDKKFERAWREGLAEWTTDPEVAGWPD